MAKPKLPPLQPKEAQGLHIAEYQLMRPSKNIKLIDALGLELKARRQELGLTQEDLAGRCELARPYLSLLEVGRKQPTISVLLLLADGLDLSLSSLLKRVQTKHDQIKR